MPPALRLSSALSSLLRHSLRSAYAKSAWRKRKCCARTIIGKEFVPKIKKCHWHQRKLLARDNFSLNLLVFFLHHFFGAKCCARTIIGKEFVPKIKKCHWHTKENMCDEIFLNFPTNRWLNSSQITRACVTRDFFKIPQTYAATLM